LAASQGRSRRLRRIFGYYEPYATSDHQALDRDAAYQEEVRNAVVTLCEAVTAQRAGKLVAAGQDLREPRPK
jgi:hypothetical protein